MANFGAGGDAVAEGAEVLFAFGGADDLLADEVGFQSLGFVVLFGGLVDLFESGERGGVFAVELEAIFEGVLGFLELFELDESLAEEVVGARARELEGDRGEGGVDGGLGIFVVQVAAGERVVGLNAGGVDREKFSGGSTGFVPLTEGGVGAAEELEDGDLVASLGADGVEVFEGFGVVAFFDFDLGLDNVRGDGLAEGFKADLEGFFGFVGEAEGELGFGESLGVVGALGVGVEIPSGISWPFTTEPSTKSPTTSCTTILPRWQASPTTISRSTNTSSTPPTEHMT